MAQQGEADQRAHGVGHGERQRQAPHAEWVHQDHGQPHVEGVLDQVEVEGHLGALHRLQDAYDVEVGAEPRKAQREHGQRPARGRCLRRRAVPVPEEERHGGLGQEQQAQGGGDDEGQHGAQPSREAGQEGGALPGGPPFSQVRSHHRHDGHRHDPVGHLQEGVGIGVGGDRVGPLGGAGEEDDHELSHLVGHHEAEGPSAEADHRAQRGVMEVPVPADGPERRRPQAGDQRQALKYDAKGGAEPQQDHFEVMVLQAGQGGAAPGQEAEPHQDGDTDHVVDDRRPGHGHEATTGIEECGGEGEEAVGGDLDHEPAQQRGGVGAFGDDGVEELGVC